jgi:hypothetical protein
MCILCSRRLRALYDFFFARKMTSNLTKEEVQKFLDAVKEANASMKKFAQVAESLQHKPLSSLFVAFNDLTIPAAAQRLMSVQEHAQVELEYWEDMKNLTREQKGIFYCYKSEEQFRKADGDKRKGAK